MLITSSYHVGTNKTGVNIKHNLNRDDYRDRLSKDKGYLIDHSRTLENVILIDRYDTKKGFKNNVLKIIGAEGREWLQKQIDDYNSGKKPSRQVKIDDLFSNDSKVHFRHQEAVIQFGNADRQTDEKSSKLMLRSAVEAWGEQHPQCYITSAVIHLDETTPHAHITFFTMARDPEPRKRGIPLALSLDKSLGGGPEHFARDRAQFESKLEQIANDLNHEIENPRLPNRKKHDDQRTHNEQVQKDRELRERESQLQESIISANKYAQLIAERQKELNERERLISEQEAKLNPNDHAITMTVWKIAQKLGMDPVHDDNALFKALNWCESMIDRVFNREKAPERENKPDSGRFG